MVCILFGFYFNRSHRDNEDLLVERGIAVSKALARLSLGISWLSTVTATGRDFIAVKVAVRWQRYAYWWLLVNPFFDATPLPGDPQVLCPRQEHDGYFNIEKILPHGSATILRKGNP